MSRLRSSPLFLIFGFVLLFVVVWALVDDARSRALGWENQPASELSFRSSDGRMIKLSDYRGKVVLIDFWGTWCGPCRQSIPGIRDLYKKYGPQGLQVMGPALEHDDGRNVPAAAQALGIEYPVGVAQRAQAEKYVSE